MFWFLLIAMVVVVAAVTMAVLGGGERPVLPETAPQRLVDPLPESRPLSAADIDAVRLPVAVRGYRMTDVDDVLSRLGAELGERDARIEELQSALARQAPGGSGGGGARQQYGQPFQQPYGQQPYGQEQYGRPYGQQQYGQRYEEQGWDPEGYPPPSGPGGQGGRGPRAGGPSSEEEGGR